MATRQEAQEHVIDLILNFIITNATKDVDNVDVVESWNASRFAKDPPIFPAVTFQHFQHYQHYQHYQL